MLDVLYEDKDVLVVVKQAGIESQTSRRLEPDMVSEIKNYLHRKAQEAKKLSTGLSPKASLSSYKTSNKLISSLLHPWIPEILTSQIIHDSFFLPLLTLKFSYANHRIYLLLTHTKRENLSLSPHIIS